MQENTTMLVFFLFLVLPSPAENQSHFFQLFVLIMFVWIVSIKQCTTIYYGINFTQ